jgi:hypothetical protein
MNNNLFKEFVYYFIRWQMSSIILAPCIYYLSSCNFIIAAVVSNAIGASIFFWVDKYFIFKNIVYFPLWEIQEDIKCVDCGQIAKGFRLVKTKNYDKTEDKNVEFRCEKCSQIKLEELKKKGVKF